MNIGFQCPGPVEIIAYFSMEIALDPAMPTYCCGLGILAGDTIRSAADLQLPMVAVTLLHRYGYFRQRLDPNGWQTEEAIEWDVPEFCQELPTRVKVNIEGRTVHLREWHYAAVGIGGHAVPALLLDADLPENSEWDRALTHHLYSGDFHYRLCQEIILGTSGVRLAFGPRRNSGGASRGCPRSEGDSVYGCLGALHR